MRHKLVSWLLCVLLLPSIALASSDDPTDSDKAEKIAFGGPSGVSGEQRDIDELLDAFRVDNRRIVMKPWYDWKSALAERSGFSFGVNAQVVYAGVSDSVNEHDDAFGGIYRLQGEWVLAGRDSGRPGSVIFRLENRSKIGSGIPPGALRTAIGSATIDPVFAYSDDFGTAFSVLAWQQLFSNKRSGFAVGLLDFSAYLDAMYYQTIARGFLNRNFILSPTLATTGIGALGAVAKGMVGENAWIGGGFFDANARSGDPGFDDWDAGELLKHAEIGWTPGFSRRATDRIQLTWWHKDALPHRNTTSGSGWLASWSWKFERWIPFVRAGWSDGGGGALAERSLSAGFSYQMAFQDWFTLGLGVNRPSDKTYQPGLDSEKVLEASYLWQITANTSLLPDLQWILDPAQHPGKNSLWSAGLRLRLTF